jgi:hypothetical protein
MSDNHSRTTEESDTDTGDGAAGTDHGDAESVRVPEDDGHPGAGTAGSEQLSTDKLFDMLASPGNRYVLTYLIRTENPVETGELVEYVVDNAGAPTDSTAGKFRGRVASRLVHANLPKLVDAGLVEYDDDEQTVSARPAIEAVAPYLDLAMSQSVELDRN